MKTWIRSLGASLRMLAVATVVLGVAYPLFGLAAGLVFPHQAEGSLITVDGKVVGSSLLGQDFTGNEWFHGRPSASNYDGLASGASNLGPNNPDLVAAIKQRIADVAALEGVAPAAVPADAVTASASGLDPQISVAYAELQVPRVAAARGLSEERVRELVADATTGRGLGMLGEPAVNFMTLNAALARE